MEFLIGFIVLAILCTAFIARLMLWVTNKSAAGAITQHFRAAEYILEHHQPPPMWNKPSRPSATLSRHGKLKLSESGENHLLERLDKLIVFFEHCPFFQTEEARVAMLLQLNDERISWIQRYQG